MTPARDFGDSALARVHRRPRCSERKVSVAERQIDAGTRCGHERGRIWRAGETLGFACPICNTVWVGAGDPDDPLRFRRVEVGGPDRHTGPFDPYRSYQPGERVRHDDHHWVALRPIDPHDGPLPIPGVALNGREWWYRLPARWDRLVAHLNPRPTLPIGPRSRPSGLSNRK